jgi:tetratricopeptide (TPR) repeat protein
MPLDPFQLLKQATVFIHGPDGNGTGYLIAPGRIATAHHVVKSWVEGKHHEVLVGSEPQRHACRARLLKVDVQHDAALLGFDEIIGNLPLPVADGSARKAAWDGYGFPQVATKNERPPGLPIDGHVQDPDTRTDRDQPAVLLYSHIIAAGNASPLHGFSGSPVTVEGALIGHIIKHIGDPDDPARAAFGYVYACPIAAVTALLDVPAKALQITPLPIVTWADRVPPLAEGEYHVFVSYRSSDRPWAMSLVARLEGAGLRVFIDQKELQLGQPLAGQLQSALTRSRAAVVLVSQGWIASRWCQQEADVLVQRAVEDKRFTLVPLRLDGSPMPALLGSRVYLDFQHSPRAEGEGVERLINSLLQPAPSQAGATAHAVNAARAAIAATAATAASSAERKLSDEFVDRIVSAGGGNVVAIHSLLKEYSRTASTDLAPLITAAEVLIGKSEFSPALQVLDGAPATLRVRQLRALALSKTGKVDEAITLLEALQREDNLDAETSGLLAGRYKARWLQRKDPAFRQRSYEAYRAAYERTGDAFNGINTAAMALHCGDSDQCRHVASQVATLLKARPLDKLDAWDKASLGEAYLLQEHFKDARHWYSQAAAAAAGLHQNIAVMRRQARLNLKALGQAENLMDEVLPVPRVLAYIGHMTDAPGRAQPRLPPAKIGTLRKALREKLGAWGLLHGFGSAARGTDMLVLETLAESGMSATAVLPFPQADFEASSVGGDWNRRLHLLQGTGSIEFKPPLHAQLPPPEQLQQAFGETNRKVFELAVAYARSLDEQPIVLAVWDGQPGDGAGGTADAVQLWRDEGHEPVVIDPHAL